MATKTATKHYEELCDMPRCLCVAAAIYIWLRRGLLTTDGKKYILGTVTSITQLGSGGFDVLTTFDDATLPTDPSTGVKLVVVYDMGSTIGTVCDPQCKGDCDWLTMMLETIALGAGGGIINRAYQLFGQNADVANGSFDIPRIPFTSGFLLTDVRITCYGYDIDTTGTFELKVDGGNIATFAGTLEKQRQLAIGTPLIAYDKMPVLVVSNIVNGVYGHAAKGLVLELIGVIAP